MTWLEEAVGGGATTLVPEALSLATPGSEAVVHPQGCGGRGRTVEMASAAAAPAAAAPDLAPALEQLRLLAGELRLLLPALRGEPAQWARGLVGAGLRRRRRCMGALAEGCCGNSGGWRLRAWREVVR